MSAPSKEPLPDYFAQPENTHPSVLAATRTFLVHKKMPNNDITIERTHVIFEDGWVVFCNLDRYQGIEKRFDVIALPSYPNMLGVEEKTDQQERAMGQQHTPWRWYREDAVEAILTARLAKVEALADEWERLTDDGLLHYANRYVADLRAALASDPTQNGTQA